MYIIINLQKNRIKMKKKINYWELKYQNLAELICQFRLRDLLQF